MCALKEGEDAFVKIGEALDSANNRISGPGSGIFGVRRNPPDPGHGSSAYQDHPTSSMLEATASRASSPKPHISSDSEIQLPSDLISSCVATLLMIQVNYLGNYFIIQHTHIIYGDCYMAACLKILKIGM